MSEETSPDTITGKGVAYLMIYQHSKRKEDQQFFIYDQNRDRFIAQCVREIQKPKQLYISKLKGDDNIIDDVVACLLKNKNLKYFKMIPPLDGKQKRKLNRRINYNRIKRPFLQALSLNLLVTALIFAAALFASFYFPATALLGNLPKLWFAAILSGSIIANTALISIFIALRHSYNVFCTHQYDDLTEQNNIPGSRIQALKAGLNSQNWGSYMKSFANFNTYRHPLAFRAGLVYTMKRETEKIEEFKNSVMPLSITESNRYPNSSVKI